MLNIQFYNIKQEYKEPCRPRVNLIMIVANMSAVTYKSFFSNFIDFLTEITSTDELYSILNEPPKQ